MNKKNLAVLLGVLSALAFVGGLMCYLFQSDCCGVKSRCICNCKES